MKGTPVRQRIPELVVPGKRLGRHVHHAPESLRYLLPPAQTVESVEWERHIPILDQGNLGSCTGNALVGALGTGPLWEALMRLLPKVPTLDEAMAVRIYSEAEKIDGGVGYPPEDEGSYGLSVAKAAKTDGFVSGFLHATSVDAAHTAMQAGAFLFGTKWFSGMDDPTSEGIVKPTGTVRGGHEIVSRQYDAARDLWWLDNSWGEGWGLGGRFALDTPSLGYLLAQQGDITSLVPLTEPAPTPGPAPDLKVTFTADEFAALDDWSRYPHLWHKASVAARAWKAATGS
jgi:hypothetical protein